MLKALWLMLVHWQCSIVILVTSFSQSSYITFMELHHYTIYLLIKKLLFMDLLKGCHYREPLDSDGSKKIHWKPGQVILCHDLNLS